MPPGLSMTSSVMPWTMNIVDSVTTIGCSRRKAMKKPLKAPTSMPMPMPTSVHSRRCLDRRVRMVVASTTLTSEMTAPAERSKPPEQNDDGLADRGERQRGAAASTGS